MDFKKTTNNNKWMWITVCAIISLILIFFITDSVLKTRKDMIKFCIENNKSVKINAAGDMIECS